MKFAEGLVEALSLSHSVRLAHSLSPSFFSPLLPLPTPLALFLLFTANRYPPLASLPDLLQVIFAQNRFNSNLGIPSVPLIRFWYH